MSILDSIKGTRKLSFNNWRYRLLHWAFGVKNPDPKNPAATGMPKFLYTHYCPLFHLTNLIAILSPIILFVKVIVVIFKGIGAGVSAIPWDKMAAAAAHLKPKPKPVDHSAPPPPKRKRSPQVETRIAVKDCCEWHKDPESFDLFWEMHASGFETLTREQVEAVFKEYYPQVVEARKRAKVKKDKLRERLIFWTNFSRVFIKWTLNVFYVALALGALYAIYCIAGPVWDGLCWFAGGIYWAFTDTGSLEIVWFIAKMVFWALLITGGIVALFRIGFIQRFAEVVGDGFAKLAPPFYLVGKFFAWVGSGFTAVGDFVKMFYEENCPPIVLISEEQAQVEAVAEQES